jgi:hypothetical protein
MILLRQKTYALRDYAGLDERAKAELLEYRNEEAKRLIDRRKQILAGAEKKQEVYNNAIDFINKNPNEWTGGANYEKLPLETQKQINKIATNNTTAEHEALSGWKDEYNKELSKTNHQVNSDRESLLRETKRRATQAAEPSAPTTPPASPKTPTNPTSAKPGTQAGSKPQNFISKNWGRVKRLYAGKSKYGTAGKYGAIGATALAVGGVGYGLYKRNKNKKNNPKKV